MKKIDLHLHTNLSDGTLSPEEVIKLAVFKGCEVISITDHDIIRDYSDLSRQYNIPIINGIEFNSSITNMHLLGYGIQDIEKVSSYMETLRAANEHIVIEVIRMLENDGFDVSINKVVDYLTEIGLSTDVLDKRKLVKYLVYKQYATGVLDCYNKLIGKNQKYYVSNIKVSPQEIINLVKKNGGISVLAHPTTLGLNSESLEMILKELLNCGLDGIEVINSKLKCSYDVLYDLLARKYNIIPTYGSDFHDYHTDDIGVDVQDETFNNTIKKLKLSRKI